MKKTVKYKNVTNGSSKELDFKTTLIADKQVPSIRSQKVMMKSSPSDLLEKQILGQVKNAYKLLEMIQEKFQGIQKQKQGGKLNQLRSIQFQIRKKQLSIKNIEVDIKELLKGIAQPNIQNFKNELKEPYLQLRNTLNTYNKKMENLAKQKQKTSKIQAKYISKCLKLGIEAISYQDFCRSHRKQSIRNSFVAASGRIKSQHRMKNLSNKDLKQKNNNLMSSEAGKNKGGQNKRIQEVYTQRDVMEAALKAAKKKHMIELSQYRSKLEFLKGEHEQLSSKVKGKMQELQNFENKFKESRAKSKSRSKQKDRNERMFKFRTELRS